MWAYGTNFFAAGIVKDDHNDPAAPCTNAAGVISLNPANVNVPAVCAGSSEVIGSIRSTFGWNELFNTKMFKQGPLNNVSFQIDADFETENILFANASKSIVAGLQFAFELPYKGFLNITPEAKFSSSHNAFEQCGYSFLKLPTANAMVAISSPGFWKRTIT